MFEIGKLYYCSEHCFLLFPDKEIAVALAAMTPRVVDYWIKRVSLQISRCNPKTPFIVLSISGNYLEILFESKKGWIYLEPQLIFYEYA